METLNKNFLRKRSKKLSSSHDGENRFVFICLAPVMVLFLTFNLIPIFISVVLSLFNYSPLSSKSPFIGLENYVNLFKDYIFIKTISNTVVFVIIAVGINLVISTFVALSINSVVHNRLRDLFRAFVFLPTVTPVVGGALIWTTIFEPNYGFIRMILANIGYNTPVYWLTDAKLVLPSVIIMTLWQDLGYNIVIVTAGLYAIPKIFYEAAYLDGASKIVVFFKITLPLLMRTVLFVSVMTIISYFQVFTQVQIMTQGGPNYASQVIALSIYQNAFAYEKMGYASAIAVLLLMIIMIISALQLKFFKQDWEY